MWSGEGADCKLRLAFRANKYREMRRLADKVADDRALLSRLRHVSASRLRRDPLRQRHERRLQVQFFLAEQRQLVAGVDEQRGQVAVVRAGRRRA